ncbi:MAG: hypothetical protein EBR01_07505 [Proteobacteria bacterium]|nr:hypothetical protein [Pseudomonadota bacterium]NBY21001.1 hypothetical protein [bacterium]
MRIISNLIFLSSLLIGLTQCGLKPAGSNESLIPSEPGAGSKTISVYVFSAPWCAECNRELPILKEKYLSELTSEQQKRVLVSIYVVTGKTAGQVATQEVADEYGKSLGLPFTMLADKYYKTYRQYFEEGNAIPAAALLDNSKTIIQLYEPGSTDLDDLFAKIKQSLN